MIENPRLDHWAPSRNSPTDFTFCTQLLNNAQVAQSVEQRTENPRVDGSIPPLGTMNSKGSDLIGAFFMSAFWSFSGLGCVGSVIIVLCLTPILLVKHYVPQ